MKQYVEEEISALDACISTVAKKIADKTLSENGVLAAEKLLKTFYKIKVFLSNEDGDDKAIDALVQSLPLLYLQIKKIN